MRVSWHPAQSADFLSIGDRKACPLAGAWSRLETYDKTWWLCSWRCQGGPLSRGALAGPTAGSGRRTTSHAARADLRLARCIGLTMLRARRSFGLHSSCFVMHKYCCSILLMRHFDNQTDGLRHVLRLWSRDAVAWVGFPTDDFKLEALREKWAERFGIRLPPHVRHDRRRRNQPNAYALSHRLAGTQRIQVWLLRTEGDLGPIESDWRKEAWRTDPPEIGGADSRLYITKEPRLRRDYAWTWRLGQKHLNLIGSQWRDLAEAGNDEELLFAIRSAATGLPMFGGVRRQLAAEMALQARRWAHKWPNKPFPAFVLPRMGRF